MRVHDELLAVLPLSPGAGFFKNDAASNDWKQAFEVAEASELRSDRQLHAASDFTIDDVHEMLIYSPGENDGPPWRAIGRLKDRRYFFLSSWCDYTGWD